MASSRYSIVTRTYLHETRTATNAYEHEMSTADHARILTALVDVEGDVILSGYRSELYDDYLNNWRRLDMNIVNHSSGRRSKETKTECLSA